MAEPVSTTAALGSAFLTGAGSAIGDAAGGLLGGTSAKKAKRIHRYQVQNEFKYGTKPTYELADQYYKDQNLWYRDNITAQEIQTKVADAKAAGLHPLAALGISTGGSGTAPMGIPSYSGTFPYDDGKGIGNAIGQGINTYLSAKEYEQRKKDQADIRDHNKALAELRLEKARKENEWLDTQIEASTLRNLERKMNSQQDTWLHELAGTESPLLAPGGIKVRKAKPVDHVVEGQGTSNFFGLPMLERPGRATGEGIGDRYGDIVEALYGLYKYNDDLKYSFGKYLSNSWNKRDKKKSLDLIYDIKNPKGAIPKIYLDPRL